MDWNNKQEVLEKLRDGGWNLKYSLILYFISILYHFH